MGIENTLLGIAGIILGIAIFLSPDSFRPSYFTLQFVDTNDTVRSSCSENRWKAKKMGLKKGIFSLSILTLAAGSDLGESG